MNASSQQSQYGMPPQHAEPAQLAKQKQEEPEFLNAINLIAQFIDALENQIEQFANRLSPLRTESNEKSPHKNGYLSVNSIRTDTPVFSLLAAVNARLESISYRLEEINQTTVI